MPMIDFILPRDALPPEKLETLMHKAVKTLMWWEKIPDTPEARKIAWAFVTETEKRHVFVGGLPPELPRYRFRVHTMEGMLEDRAKQGIIRDLTRLVLEAEGVPHDLENASRVWCIIREYPRNNWGIGGYLFPPSGYATAAKDIRVSPDDVSV